MKRKVFSWLGFGSKRGPDLSGALMPMPKTRPGFGRPPVPASPPAAPVPATSGMAVYADTKRHPVVWFPDAGDPPTRIVVGRRGGDV